MRRSWRSTSLLVAAIVALAGCSAAGFATQAGEMTGDEACPSEQLEAGVRVLSCFEAVAAAERALEQPHWPIAAANFARGVGNCPRMPSEAAVQVAAAPGFDEQDVRLLRCSRIGRNTNGVVEFDFWFGEPVRMYVALDENGIAVASSSFMEVDDVEPPLGPGFVEP